MAHLKNYKLSFREKDIMTVLWKSSHSLTASAISKENSALSINTIQTGLRNLLKKGFIKVDNIVYSGTVLTRSYIPVITIEEYAANQLNALSSSVLNFSTFSFMDFFLSEGNSLCEIEEAIEKMKKRGDK